jgi:hypothetical protein
LPAERDRPLATFSVLDRGDDVQNPKIPAHLRSLVEIVPECTRKAPPSSD